MKEKKLMHFFVVAVDRSHFHFISLSLKKNEMLFTIFFFKLILKKLNKQTNKQIIKKTH